MREQRANGSDALGLSWMFQECRLCLHRGSAGSGSQMRWGLERDTLPLCGKGFQYPANGLLNRRLAVPHALGCCNTKSSNSWRRSFREAQKTWAEPRTHDAFTADE